jgi:hypothetical protein
MKVTLTLLDRVWLLGILPAKSDLLVMRSISAMKKRTSLTEKEIKDFEVKQHPNGGLMWNEKGARSIRSMEFTPLEIDFIKLGLIEKSKAKEVTEEMLVIADKFKFDDSIFKQ